MGDTIKVHYPVRRAATSGQAGLMAHSRISSHYPFPVIAGYLATHGPITVTINMKLLQVGGTGGREGADWSRPWTQFLCPPPLQGYQKGVIKATHTNCDPQLVDHSVLLVGFGRDKEGIQSGTVSSQARKPRRRWVPYWILKNSWGAEWGEKVRGVGWGRGGLASSLPSGTDTP